MLNKAALCISQSGRTKTKLDCPPNRKNQGPVPCSSRGRPAIACLSKTTTQKSTELLKERLHSFDVEQLIRKPKSENRSQVSWDQILCGYQEALASQATALRALDVAVWT